MAEIFQVESVGAGATIQDLGRRGWKRFGVPPSGAMDDHAAAWANRLLHNPVGAPVLEILLQGARLSVLEDVWVAVTGADLNASIPEWRAVRLREGDELRFPHNRYGIWAYLAVEDGFSARRFLGSASTYPRGLIGEPIEPGTVLEREEASGFHLPMGVAGRFVPEDERRNYDRPPLLRVWPGPQWADFSERERGAFFKQNWLVSSQSDRVGYRLKGTPVAHRLAELASEPVLVGTVQIPPSGEPLITMRDGPTVGGYPKLAVLDPADVSWLAQCRPGTQVRFCLAEPLDATRPPQDDEEEELVG